MGNIKSAIGEMLWQQREMRTLIVGLDAAGKTTILYKLKLGEVVTTIPTIGFNVETVEFKNMFITAWDVGGRDKIRPLWRHYYQNTQALIMVVDSNDRHRMNYAKEELDRMLSEDELQNCVLLVFANKQDLPNAMSTEEIAEELRLSSLRNRTWHIQESSAITGDGLYEGLDWMMKAVAVADQKQSRYANKRKPEFRHKSTERKNVNDSKHDSLIPSWFREIISITASN